MSSRSTQFRVLITGGGIAGLTLANALQHAGIDYLLLEARDDFAPQLGASIGIGPNGGRILDQLGCYGDIMANTVPLDHTSSRNSKGGYIRPKTDGFRLVQARSNYCMCFLDRQTVLSILAKHICDKKKLLLNKRIVQADESPDGVTIICKDGTTYSGDILVGADGAHSIVRHEMWRAAELRSPGEISDEEKGSMFAEYRCIYAISKSIPGLPPREFAVTFKKDVTPIVITSREDRVYWFLIERMPEIRRYGQIPRFNKTDAEALVAKHMEIPLTDDGNITVNDLWQNCITHSIVPLEEAFYKHWSFGRFVCLGDSAHKMTPNSGSGGNSAIEGAAALANELHSLVQHNRRPGSSVPTESISTALSNYQKTRQIRASATVTAANYVTRFHALRGLAEYISANYLMPYSGDLLVDLASDTWIGAVRIRYLPLPQRSMLGTMPFNPEQGTGKNESMLIRAAAAAPFLLISIYGLQPQGDGSKPIAVPSLAELMDLGVIYGLILMESTRRASTLTPIQIPLLLIVGSLHFGLETALPIYFFTYYTFMPITRFRASDLRLTDLSYSRSILPLVLILWHVPSLISGIDPGNKLFTPLLKFVPFVISAAQLILRASGISASTIHQDRLNNTTRDMPTLLIAGNTLAAISAATWLASNVFQLVTAPTRIVASFTSTGLLLYSSSLLWIMYLFNDLQRAGMVRRDWVFTIGASSILLGPAATIAWFWTWRETLLATKRHWGAIVTPAHDRPSTVSEKLAVRGKQSI